MTEGGIGQGDWSLDHYDSDTPLGYDTRSEYASALMAQDTADRRGESSPHDWGTIGEWRAMRAATEALTPCLRYQHDTRHNALIAYHRQRKESA